MTFARTALFAVAFVVAAVLSPFSSAGSEKVALLAAIDGAIGPASSKQLEEALDTAARRDAAVLILEIDTPGGLVTSMREHKGYLYLGGVFNNRLGRLKLPNADPNFNDRALYFGNWS